MSSLSEKNKKRLLQVAGKMFATSGFAAVSTREMCEKAGVNVAAISYYFAGKEGLYLQVFKDSALNFSKALEETLQKHAGEVRSKKKLEIALREIILSFILLRIRHPEMAIVFQREALEGIPGLKEEFDAIITPIGDKLVDFFSSLQAARLIRSDLNVHSFLIVVVESIWGYFSMQERGLWTDTGGYQLPKDHQEFADFLANMYFRGISA